jgi:hypothetical protein
VQSRLNLGESKNQMNVDAVINLMNPKTLSNQKIASNMFPKAKSLILVIRKQLTQRTACASNFLKGVHHRIVSTNLK